MSNFIATFIVYQLTYVCNIRYNDYIIKRLTKICVEFSKLK